jgi:hypothetical protein
VLHTPSGELDYSTAVSMAFRYRGGELLSLRGEHRRAGGRNGDGHGWIQRDSGDRFCRAVGRIRDDRNILLRIDDCGLGI